MLCLLWMNICSCMSRFYVYLCVYMYMHCYLRWMRVHVQFIKCADIDTQYVCDTDWYGHPVENSSATRCWDRPWFCSQRPDPFFDAMALDFTKRNWFCTAAKVAHVYVRTRPFGWTVATPPVDPSRLCWVKQRHCLRTNQTTPHSTLLRIIRHRRPVTVGMAQVSSTLWFIGVIAQPKQMCRWFCYLMLLVRANLCWSMLVTMAFTSHSWWNITVPPQGVDHLESGAPGHPWIRRCVPCMVFVWSLQIELSEVGWFGGSLHSQPY